MSLLSSLSNRIFLASALLTVLSIGVAVFVINRTATARAEEDLERSLEEAGTLVEQFQSLLFEHLVREARLIADLPKLKAAVDVDHEPTVQPLAADYRTQIDADLFLVTNRDGRTLGLAEDLGIPPAEVADFEGTRQAKAGHETVSFWPRPEGLLQVVSVPIYVGPEVLGTLTAGVSLDRRLATRIKALTRTEVVFGSQGVIHASTLPDANRAALAPLLTTPGVSTVVVGGEEFVAVRRLLALGPAQRGVTPGPPGATDNSGSPGAPAGPGGAPAGTSTAAQAGGPGSSSGASTNSTATVSGSSGSGSAGAGADPARAPVAVILRSRTEHLRFLRTLHTALALTALAAVIGATVLSFAVARTITRPLGGLIATMREMAATGDLTRQLPSVPASRWEDEDARVLTTTFRALTASLSRFQHEAAQRERLSSLGRLSTVVAHEIRNPLMIIKASLRTLRRDARHPDASEAIGDIEEEVRRLNALVNEVLDYAKPIRFDYGAVELNALCRAAATAASAEQPAPAVRLIEDQRAGEIVTDAERLRLVLINVLTNARDAVLARQAGAETATPATGTLGAPAAPVAPVTPAATAGADVELRTDCPGADTVRITVTDRGIGILPDHLARIFDPFFTTKRTGSGLGLAIAKNIVEGLGGTIAIASEPSRGTTVRITLPREAPRDRRQAEA